jgi:nicotinamide riboside kinase
MYKAGVYFGRFCPPHRGHLCQIVGASTKCLAKLYNTSWAEEVGRYYTRDYLGNDETVFTSTDFDRIAHLQYEQDYHALRSANRVCFFDTDATYTDCFSELFLGGRNGLVEAYIDPERYDMVLYPLPDVRRVDDGQRLKGDRNGARNSATGCFPCIKRTDLAIKSSFSSATTSSGLPRRLRWRTN